jgi:hypothetical protein
MEEPAQPHHPTHRNRTRHCSSAASGHLQALNKKRRSFPTTWGSLTMREQRALVTVLTRSITVTSATPNGRQRYDPNRVHVTWRA